MIDFLYENHEKALDEKCERQQACYSLPVILPFVYRLSFVIRDNSASPLL